MGNVGQTWVKAAITCDKIACLPLAKPAERGSHLNGVGQRGLKRQSAKVLSGLAWFVFMP